MTTPELMDELTKLEYKEEVDMIKAVIESGDYNCESWATISSE